MPSIVFGFPRPLDSQTGCDRFSLNRVEFASREELYEECWGATGVRDVQPLRSSTEMLLGQTSASPSSLICEDAIIIAEQYVGSFAFVMRWSIARALGFM